MQTASWLEHRKADEDEANDSYRMQVLELAAVKLVEEPPAGGKSGKSKPKGPRTAQTMPNLRKNLGAEIDASGGGEGGEGGEGGAGGAAAEAAAATQAERAAVLGSIDALEKERQSN